MQIQQLTQNGEIKLNLKLQNSIKSGNSRDSSILEEPGTYL